MVQSSAFPGKPVTFDDHSFFMIPANPPRLQTIHHPNGFPFTVLRLDEIHPHAGGNKLYKLKYNLETARAQGHDTLLTFGGAFSNHIAATAAAGREAGFKTIGVIRGEAEALQNPTLQFAVAQGMTLHFTDRASYRLKHTPGFLKTLEEQFGSFFLIPEGGANSDGVRGCTAIADLAGNAFTHIALACGTGTTLAGIAAGAADGVRILGFPVLKNGEFLEAEIEQHIVSFTGRTTPVRNWELHCAYHFGGYAKVPDALRVFKKEFETAYAIPLDYVYTAKLMAGVFDLAAAGYFPAEGRVLLVHTGGLQGNAGFER